MSETEKQIGSSENKPGKEANESDLKIAIGELSKLEDFLFDGDGKIGGDSNDTPIDEEYEKQIKNATDIKTKIEIVKRIYDYFLAENFLIEDHKKSKYIDDEDRKNLDEIDLQIKKMISKYPAYKKTIILYIKEEFDRIDGIVSFYENDYKKTGDKDNIDAIPKILKQIYKNLPEYNLKWLVESIDYVEKNEKIKGERGKVLFLEKLIKYGNIFRFKDLDKIMNFEFYKNGSNYKYGKTEDGLDGDLILIELSNIAIKDLEEINKLYIKSTKNGNKAKQELVDYIDKNFDLKYKNYLLNVKNLKEIYIDMKRSSLCIKNSDLVNKNCLLYLSNIKDDLINFRIQLFISEFYSNDGNFEAQYDFLNNFIENDLKSLLRDSSLGDKYFIVSIIKELYFNPCGNNYKEVDENLSKMKKKLEPLEYKINNIYNEELSKAKEEVIRILKEKINSNISVEEVSSLVKLGLIKIERNKGGDGTKRLNYIVNPNISQEELLKAINALNPNYKQQDKGKQDNKPLESGKKISESEIQKKQQKANKLGLKIEITDEGKMVGKNGEKEFSTKIENGKIEVGGNDKLIYTTSLGYKFELENNDLGSDKILEITETFSYLNKIGLGYFGNNFKSMIESIKNYLPRETSYLNIDENSGNFLSMTELYGIVIPIFKNLGFIDNSQNLDYLAPDEITDTVMSYRLTKIPGGESFQKGKPFNEVIFGEMLKKIIKV